MKLIEALNTLPDELRLRNLAATKSDIKTVQEWKQEFKDSYESGYEVATTKRDYGKRTCTSLVCGGMTVFNEP